MNTKNGKAFLFTGILLLFLTVFLLISTSAFADTSETSLVTTRNDFINALASSNEGDIILVGDIDFNLSGTGAVNVAERIIISKSITVKSGKANNEKAIFTGASFDIKGTAVAGELNTVKFDGITFDEKLDTESLTNTDWELSYDSLNTPISPQPLKAQYAVQFFGNIAADFENCDFKNYMYTYGAAINAYYNSDGIEHSDNKHCSLKLTLNGCNFTSNAALYGGGAIYLQANNKNISLKAVNCVFYQNKVGFINYASGGGAIYTHGSDVELIACDFNKNVANHYYGGEKPTNDTASGGAVYCNGDNVSNGCTLIMRGCSVKENKASNGGGISLDVVSKVIIDNCYISGNSAKPACEDTRSVWGLSSNQGQGGGMYFDGTQGDITIINTDVTDNYAESIFPAICHETSGDEGLLSVEIVLCTIANNTCGTEMSEYKNFGNPAWIWFTYPGDIYELPYISTLGCIIIDEDFDKTLPRYETPTAENNHNYFAPPARAVLDGYDSEDSHRSIVAAQIIPKELYSPYFEKIGITPFGDFHIGSNHKASVKILLNDGSTDLTKQINYTYGVSVELPTPSKKWFVFDGWFTDDGVQISNVSFVFAHNIDKFSLTSKYSDAFPYENIIGGNTTVNSDGTITLVAAAAPEGQLFKGWQLNGEIISTDSTYSFEFAEGMVIKAIYEPKGASAGTVTVVVLSCTVGCIIITLSALYLLKRNKKAVSEAAAVTEAAPIEKLYPDTNNLTEREKQVLELLLQGKKRSEIAALLFVSEETVKKQITSIYGKLGVATRSELFAMFK